MGKEIMHLVFFSNFIHEKGLEHQKTQFHTSHQNGVVEKNQIKGSYIYIRLDHRLLNVIFLWYFGQKE